MIYQKVMYVGIGFMTSVQVAMASGAEVQAGSVSMLWLLAPMLFLASTGFSVVRRQRQGKSGSSSEEVSPPRESEQRLRSLLESGHDIVWELDVEGVFTYLSPQVEEVLGYAPVELLGQSFAAVLLPAEASNAMEQLRMGVSTGIIPKAVYAARNKGGEKVFLESRGTPFYSEQGDVVGFRGVALDITAQVEAQEALRRSEKRYRLLVACSSDWIWEVDTEGRYTYCGPQSLPLLGYRPEELEGKLFSHIVDSEEVERISALFSEIEQAREPFQCLVNTCRHKDGRRVIMETSGTPIFDGKGNLTGFRGVDHDITARVTAEKQLAAERELFHDFMEHAPDPIYFKDSESRFIQVNRALAEVMGDSVEGMVGKTDYDYYPREQALLRRHEEKEIMRSGEPIRKEEMGKTPTGVKWFLTTKVPYYDLSGKLSGMFGTSTDITEQKQVEEQLRLLRGLLGDIVDSMPSILMGVDEQERIILWNHTVAKELGVTSTEVVGRPLVELLPEFVDLMGSVQEVSRTHMPQTFSRMSFPRHEGRFCDVTIYPLTEYRTGGAVIRVDDVTERVHMERLVVQHEKMLSVGELAAGMAHEINNPLAGILQSIAVMRHRLDATSKRNQAIAESCGVNLAAVLAYLEERGLLEMIDSMEEAGERAARIVENLLCFSRAGRFCFEPNDLSEVIDKSIAMVSSDYDLRRGYDFRKIQIRCDCDPSLGPVVCEANQIQQVLINLLTNSAQAMAAGEVRSPRIELRLKHEDSMAVLELSDNGPGMDEEVCKRIFDPFFTTRSTGCGTGLGLTVSYFIIVKNHGGSMEVESEPGQGSRFSIRLPLDHP